MGRYLKNKSQWNTHIIVSILDEFYTLTLRTECYETEVKMILLFMSNIDLKTWLFTTFYGTLGLFILFLTPDKVFFVIRVFDHPLEL